MFAAIQAHIIYLIMRVVDDMPQHPESDLQMLVSFQVRHGYMSLLMIPLLLTDEDPLRSLRRHLWRAVQPG